MFTFMNFNVASRTVFYCLLLLLFSCFEDMDTTEFSLVETANIKVQHDAYKATLRYESINNTVIVAQENVNKKIQNTIKNLSSLENIQISTGRYYTSKNWNNQLKKYSTWTASHQIIVNSTDKQSLVNAVGIMQKYGFTVESFDSYLTKKTRESYTNKLITKAIQQAKSKINIVAINLNKQKVNITQVKLNNEEKYAPPVFALSRSAMQSDMEKSNYTNPSMEAGKQEISATVTIKALLSGNSR